jgi:hypothetical protein
LNHGITSRRVHLQCAQASCLTNKRSVLGILGRADSACTRRRADTLRLTAATALSPRAQGYFPGNLCIGLHRSSCYLLSKPPAGSLSRPACGPRSTDIVVISQPLGNAGTVLPTPCCDVPDLIMSAMPKTLAILIGGIGETDSVNLELL